MFRWLEQVEMKHYEFIRVIRSHAYMAEAWHQVGSQECTGGQYEQAKRAYAMRQEWTYDALKNEAKRLCLASGEPLLVAELDCCIKEPGRMVECVENFRKAALAWMPLKVSVFVRCT